MSKVKHPLKYCTHCCYVKPSFILPIHHCFPWVYYGRSNEMDSHVWRKSVLIGNLKFRVIQNSKTISPALSAGHIAVFILGVWLEIVHNDATIYIRHGDRELVDLIAGNQNRIVPGLWLNMKLILETCIIIDGSSIWQNNVELKLPFKFQ
jgi:hypothetical protein